MSSDPNKHDLTTPDEKAKTIGHYTLGNPNFRIP